MQNTILLEDALNLDNPIFIDMRAPAEFEHGSIPGAVNIPLLDNEERAAIGILHRTQGPDKAKQQGLAIVSAKLPELVSEIRAHCGKDRSVVVYCWRGGMRSKSVVSVLELMGIRAYQLVGGYKAYRRYVLDTLAGFALRPEIVVLCGSTGTGKTKLLDLLAGRGVPVIDLEHLANHRGSVFGQVGLGKPQTAQNFDARLLAELRRLNDEPFIVVECESKRIGNVYLPEALFQAMKRGKHILVEASLETRVARLIDEYLDLYDKNRDALLASIQSLESRLGKAKTKKLQEAFAANKVRDVAGALLVDYYDPLYGYEKADPKDFDCLVDAENLEEASCRIIEYLNVLRR